MKRLRDARGHFIKVNKVNKKLDPKKSVAPVTALKRSHTKKIQETHTYTGVAYIDFKLTADSKPDRFDLANVSDQVETVIKKMGLTGKWEIVDATVSMLYKEPKVDI